MKKIGVNYKNILEELNSFDLVLFSGDDIYSKMIKYVEHFQIKTYLDSDYNKYIYSHVGIVVKNDVLPFLPPNEVFIWESTISGTFGEGVKNIDGRSFLGVQVRNLAEVIEAYDKSPDTRIAVSQLIGYNKEKISEFKDFYNKYNNTIYDINAYSLLSAICPCFRPARATIEDILGTEELLFCSEMATCVYKILEVFPNDINEKDVVPQDFLGGDIDKKIPVGVFKPHIVITKYPE